jgi:hypothetical protein
MSILEKYPLNKKKINRKPKTINNHFVAESGFISRESVPLAVTRVAVQKLFRISSWSFSSSSKLLSSMLFLRLKSTYYFSVFVEYTQFIPLPLREEGTTTYNCNEILHNFHIFNEKRQFLKAACFYMYRRKEKEHQVSPYLGLTSTARGKSVKCLWHMF